MRAEFLNKNISYFCFQQIQGDIGLLTYSVRGKDFFQLHLRSFLYGRDIEKLQIMFYTVKSFQSPDETFMPVITVKKKMSDWSRAGNQQTETETKTEPGLVWPGWVLEADILGAD